MAKRTTIKDVAKKINVTISTVSRALNDHHTISEKTKKLVRETAEELNYSPNKVASNLRKGTGNSIGVIIPKINSDFMSNCIFGIEGVTYPAGYNLIICQSNENYEKEIHNINTLIDSQVSGIIMSLSSQTVKFNHIKKIIDKKIALIMFDRISESLNTNTIVNDDYEASKDAIEHLVNNGYKKIAYIGWSNQIYVYKNRLNGYLNSLKTFNLENNDRWIITNIESKEESYNATKLLFKTKKNNSTPDAIFCSSDRIALGALKALTELGLKVPQDVGLIGYSNDPVSDIISPSITTIEQFPQELGANAAKIMIELLEQKQQSPAQAFKKIMIRPTLLIRESSNRNS